MTFNLKGYNIVEVDGENQLDETPTTYTFTLNNVNGKFESSGLSMALITHQDNFGKVMQNTFTNFGEGSLAIFKAVGNLFIGKAGKTSGELSPFTPKQPQF